MIRQEWAVQVMVDPPAKLPRLHTGRLNEKIFTAGVVIGELVSTTSTGLDERVDHYLQCGRRLDRGWLYGRSNDDSVLMQDT